MNVILHYIKLLLIFGYFCDSLGTTYKGWKFLLIYPLNSTSHIRSLNLELEDKRHWWKLVGFSGVKGTLSAAIDPKFEKLVFRELSKRGLNYSILHSDVNNLITRNEIRRGRSIRNKQSVHGSYLTFQEMEEYFERLKDRYPKLLQHKVIGKSFEGRPLHMFKISLDIQNTNPVSKNKQNAVNSKNNSKKENFQKDLSSKIVKPNSNTHNFKAIPEHFPGVRPTQSSNVNHESHPIPASWFHFLTKPQKDKAEIPLNNFGFESIFNPVFKNSENDNNPVFSQIRQLPIINIGQSVIQNSFNRKARAAQNTPYTGHQNTPVNTFGRTILPASGGSKTNATHNDIYLNINKIFQKINSTVINSSGSRNKPIIFIDAGMHSREWITTAACLYALEKLLQEPKWLRDVEWRIVPIINPDGYVYSWEKDRFWRKTRSINANSQCRGADMNRNFGFKWGEVDTSKNPCEEHYGGLSAFSEVESRVLRDELWKDKDRIKAYINLHSWGQFLLYAYSFSPEFAPDNTQELIRVGQLMVDAIKQRHDIKYYVANSASGLYPASGTADDWANEILRVPVSYLFELRDEGQMGFLLPEKFIKPTGEELFTALKVLVTEVKNGVKERN